MPAANYSELYVMPHCESCTVSHDKLLAAGIQFKTIELDDTNMEHMFKVWVQRLGSNPNSVPQFWYNGTYVGNSSNIDNFLKEYNVT